VQKKTDLTGGHRKVGFLAGKRPKRTPLPKKHPTETENARLGAGNSSWGLTGGWTRTEGTKGGRLRKPALGRKPNIQGKKPSEYDPVTK